MPLQLCIVWRHGEVFGHTCILYLPMHDESCRSSCTHAMRIRCACIRCGQEVCKRQLFIARIGDGGIYLRRVPTMAPCGRKATKQQLSYTIVTIRAPHAVPRMREASWHAWAR